MEEMRLYEIVADYRPKNPNKPKYYVWANTANDARKIFGDIISWLKIYSVTVMNKSDADLICGEPDRHIIIEGWRNP